MEFSQKGSVLRGAIVAMCISLLLVFACRKKDGDKIQAYEPKTIINAFANKVVIATYRDLEQKSDALLQAVEILKANKNDASLQHAQDAWKSTRRPWEQSESFLFGPVDTNGYDPKLDSWPVNKVDLDAVLSSGDKLTVPYIETLEDELKGFHTIEYLLFGNKNDQTVKKLDVRKMEYLLATVKSLRKTALDLYKSWMPSGGNFVLEVTGAGSSSKAYGANKDVLQEMVNGMVGIVDEVGNGKIGDPYNQKDPTLVESQFSCNSLQDFQDNITGVKNVYMGSYTGVSTAGSGLTSFVSETNPELDNKIKLAMSEAIASIVSIPYPFQDSITKHPTHVGKAVQAIGNLQAILEGDLSALISDSEFK